LHQALVVFLATLIQQAVEAVRIGSSDDDSAVVSFRCQCFGKERVMDTLKSVLAVGEAKFWNA